MNDDEDKIVDENTKQRTSDHQIIYYCYIVLIMEMFKDSLSDIVALTKMFNDKLTGIASDGSIKYCDERDECKSSCETK